MGYSKQPVLVFCALLLPSARTVEESTQSASMSADGTLRASLSDSQYVNKVSGLARLDSYVQDLNDPLTGIAKTFLAGIFYAGTRAKNATSLNSYTIFTCASDQICQGIYNSEINFAVAADQIPELQSGSKDLTFP